MSDIKDTITLPSEDETEHCKLRQQIHVSQVIHFYSSSEEKRIPLAWLFISLVHKEINQ